MGLKRTLCDYKNSEHSYTGSGTWNYWLTLTAGCEENQQVHSFPLEELTLHGWSQRNETAVIVVRLKVVQILFHLIGSKGADQITFFRRT